MEIDEMPLFKQLMEAAAGNQTAQVKLLLDQHNLSSAVTQTSWGKDPLAWAAHHGNIEMTQLLLQNGFELATGAANQSALHSAAYHKNCAILRLLLTYPFYIPKKKEIAKTKKELWHKLKKSSDGNCNLQFFTRLPERVLIQHLFNHDSIDGYVHSLAVTHCERILQYLTARTEIVSVLMTPYEAASDVGAEDCKQLLEPNGLEDRLCPEIIENYKSALQDALTEDKSH